MTGTTNRDLQRANLDCFRNSFNWLWSYRLSTLERTKMVKKWVY